jgi:hypothetical protein
VALALLLILPLTLPLSHCGDAALSGVTADLWNATPYATVPAASTLSLHTADLRCVVSYVTIPASATLSVSIITVSLLL